MKSRIRSRWYRASEKPLDSESKSNQMPKTPTGEISLLNGASLKDDLRDERAKKVARNGPNQKQPLENETAAGKGHKDRKKAPRDRNRSRNHQKRKGSGSNLKNNTSHSSAERNQNNASNKSLKRSKAKNKQPQKNLGQRNRIHLTNKQSSLELPSFFLRYLVADLIDSWK